MTKSRMTALLLTLPTAGNAAAAEPVNAERAMEAYRDRLKPVAELDCPTSDDPDEIVVCGRRDGRDPHRLVPLPDVEPEGPRRLLSTKLGPGEAWIEPEQVVRPDGFVDKRIMVRFKTAF